MSDTLKCEAHVPEASKADMTSNAKHNYSTNSKRFETIEEIK
jgi:hypothetical protein